MPFSLPAPASVHFLGIGGVGMAGVAWLMKRRGWKVSGCDASSNNLMDWIAAEGISVSSPHDAAHIHEFNPALIVRTPAVHSDNEELAAAVAAGVKVASRGEVLAAMSGDIPTIAVCGSHGKTTTATFIATIFKALAPERLCWCIGGVAPSLGAVAGAPQAIDAAHSIMVAEADESDGSLALYAPWITVVTNVDLDHADAFSDVAEFEKVFAAVIARTSGPIVYCADHPRATALCIASHHKDRVSYGFSKNADWRIADLVLAADSSTFTITGPDGAILSIRLGVPGRHNALNAAGAIAAAVAAGLPPTECARVLERFASLPARRFEKIGNPDGFTVISDYSHHPVEIRALIATALKLPHKRIVAVFEPHRYTRTKTFLQDFPPAFRGVDCLVLAPVYAASEPCIDGGSSADLYAAFRKQAAEAPSQAPGVPPIPVPIFAESLADALEYLKHYILEGDVVLVIGAGTVVSIAKPISEAHVNTPEMLPKTLKLSGYGTAAPAPYLKTVASAPELKEALLECSREKRNVHIIGAGTNTLVAATGCYDRIIRLRGEEFSFISPEYSDGKTRLRIGAATPGFMIMEYCKSFGLSGLEFMVDIPGWAGGWLAMNAGTRFGSFCDVVSKVWAVNKITAKDAVLSKEDLRAQYRKCPGLDGYVAMNIVVELKRTTRDEVAAAMADYATRRLPLARLRTCGSVFKNPTAIDATAGQLSDRALCKGLRIGGASVIARHANIIAADESACASDVQALIHSVHDRVLCATGVDLEREVRILR